ncbi:hypothetical protein A3Q56_00228 [Intoshia linei]|uniref:Uncharacterized protein n=1 Tax=Intoshia linei TaxID=1819745 RepID=A0A177BEM7_9BILA|nr:hypothetical protein A3Q56_00228 [Intoshia linei]
MYFLNIIFLISYMLYLVFSIFQTTNLIINIYLYVEYLLNDWTYNRMMYSSISAFFFYVPFFYFLWYRILLLALKESNIILYWLFFGVSFYFVYVLFQFAFGINPGFSGIFFGMLLRKPTNLYYERVLTFLVIPVGILNFIFMWIFIYVIYKVYKVYIDNNLSIENSLSKFYKRIMTSDEAYDN